MNEPYYTVETLQPTQNIGYLLKRCGVLLTQIADRRFAEQPISFTQWIILIRLTHQTHLSPTALSEHLGYDMGFLTRIVDELIDRELVLRKRPNEDRRAVHVIATTKGSRLAVALEPLVLDLVNELVEPNTHAETDAMIALLQRMLTHLESLAGRVRRSGAEIRTKN